MTNDDRPILRLGHSPDPDDAFMWWPLVVTADQPARIDTGRFRYQSVMDDIESLNQRSMTGELEITAMSCAQYPHVKELYAITACGSSMGDRYGPKLVASRPMQPEDLCSPDIVTVIPGERTSAFAAMSLRLGAGSFRYDVLPFDEIIPAVQDGRYVAGLVIHEGQLTFARDGLQEVLDLGVWWSGAHNGLPLPLGINTVRRDLEDVHGPSALAEIADVLRRSLDYALEHRSEAVAYALNYARDMERDLADRFIEMYVNRWTLDFGPTGQQAVGTFLGELAEAGLTPDAGAIDAIAASAGA